MKIYFDVSTLNPEKITGVGVYMLQLLRCYESHKELDVIPALKLSRLKSKKNVEVLVPQKKCTPLPPFKFFRDDGCLYHGPDFKLNVSGRIPKVVTVHDMVVFEGKYNTPDFYHKGIRQLSRVLNSPPDAVIANSEFTKSQVLRFFPRLKEIIHVTHLGCDRSRRMFDRTASVRTMDLPGKYVLFLGTLEKRKNVLGVLRAFEILKSWGFEEKLVLAGAWGFGAEEIKQALAKSSVKDHIIHLNYVPDEKLPELFGRAEVFFFPSWYEGFGIPVLEAMASNCPVVTSPGGALQEICGDAALFADPADCEQMANALQQVLADESLQTSLRDKGMTRAQGFTWDKCAHETIQVYNSVLRS